MSRSSNSRGSCYPKLIYLKFRRRLEGCTQAVYVKGFLKARFERQPRTFDRAAKREGAIGRSRFQSKLYRVLPGPKAVSGGAEAVLFFQPIESLKGI